VILEMWRILAAVGSQCMAKSFTGVGMCAQTSVVANRVSTIALPAIEGSLGGPKIRFAVSGTDKGRRAFGSHQWPPVLLRSAPTRHKRYRGLARP